MMLVRKLPALLSALSIGCTGLIDDPGRTATDPGTVAGRDSGTGTVECTEGPSVGHTPVARLTNTQYANAVRDLLAPLDVGNPREGLVAESALGGFRSNAAIPVTELELRGYSAQAVRLAELAAANAEQVFGCAPTSREAEGACVRAFVDRFATRAYRRPVEPAEIDRLVALFDLVRSEGESFAGAASMLVEVVLQSPHFIYRLELPEGAPGEIVPLSGHQIAARLSFFLWDTIPDEALLAAAAAGELDGPEGVVVHARTMLEAPQAQHGIESFHLQWLGVDDVSAMDKDVAVYPIFDRALARLMRDETATFVDRVVRTGDGSYEALLLGGFSYVEGDLYTLYGISPDASGTPWARVEFDPEVRSGVLTQASFLATHAHPDQTSPVHRGKTIRENFFCETLPAPPADVADTPPDPDPSLTTRERFAAHREVEWCADCHQFMDPLGLAFEAFDALGQHRTMEAGRAVDTSGEVVGTDVPGEIDGARELSERIYESEQARLCLVKNWYRFALGRMETGADQCSIRAAYDTFEHTDRNVRELMVAIAASDAFRFYRIPEEER